jgi:hypothetical protein
MQVGVDVKDDIVSLSVRHILHEYLLPVEQKSGRVTLLLKTYLRDAASSSCNHRKQYYETTFILLNNYCTNISSPHFINEVPAHE